MARPARVRLIEVGPRDGLQNEPVPIPVETKLALVERLAAAGLPVVEAGSFVSARRVPQMAGSAELYRRLKRRPGTAYPALVPNLQGLAAALDAGVTEAALFISASEGFSQRNIACSMAESLVRLAPVAGEAANHRVRLRGYVSCVLGCPYDGAVAPETVAEMAERLLDLGCDEVSLGDTIGIGTADGVRRLLEAVARRIPRERIAMHFHDTYGQGVANVLTSLDEGIAAFDCSVAGLGGCPFAAGATGNVATEDVLYLLDGLGIETGIDLRSVAETGAWISAQLGRDVASRAGRALLS
ncbi:hydroxymethylglutaryl-CoA lyase [Magnetospirillum molischianum]|uniref:hydroxymethylglutaryl-CoA lyase n=1 Tax=Magnetospirillum molischianum DSM 120 TaxID=1150626 RepID=H8FS92_MAGML|nr:hydroxymethylglutaryl-CoA lyase [Magnetospirillum molischianum]CCG41230.1 hydroxymethylglutaryl-CoA lyase (HMG-CoA lyase) (HL) (3-hydroxy-3-methylglutarate-CoA lyase) [Magnetospirillum molischianum DSM 120]